MHVSTEIFIKTTKAIYLLFRIYTSCNCDHNKKIITYVYVSQHFLFFHIDRHMLYYKIFMILCIHLRIQNYFKLVYTYLLIYSNNFIEV